MKFHLIQDYEADAAGARGVLCMARTEEVFEHHFPERPVVPGNLVLEAAAQLAHLHEMARSAGTTAFVLDRVTTGRWLRIVGPDERIGIQLTSQDAGPDRRAYAVTCTVDGATSATMEIAGRLVAQQRDPGEVLS